MLVFDNSPLNLQQSAVPALRFASILRRAIPKLIKKTPYTVTTGVYPQVFWAYLQPKKVVEQRVFALEIGIWCMCNIGGLLTASAESSREVLIHSVTPSFGSVDGGHNAWFVVLPLKVFKMLWLEIGCECFSNEISTPGEVYYFRYWSRKLLTSSGARLHTNRRAPIRGLRPELCNRGEKGEFANIVVASERSGIKFQLAWMYAIDVIWLEFQTRQFCSTSVALLGLVAKIDAGTSASIITRLNWSIIHNLELWQMRQNDQFT